MHEKLSQSNSENCVFLIFENRGINVSLNSIKTPWACKFWTQGSERHWLALFQGGKSAIYSTTMDISVYTQPEVILVKDTFLKVEEVEKIEPLLRDKQVFVVWHINTDPAVYKHNYALFENANINITSKIGQSHTSHSIYYTELIDLYKTCEIKDNQEAYYAEIAKLKNRFRYRNEIDLIKQLTILGKYKASGKLNCNISTPEQHAEKVFTFDKITLDWRNFEPEIDKKIVKMLGSDAKTYEMELNKLRNELLPIE